MTNHIHKYRRRNIGRNGDYWVMACKLPRCTHYVPMSTKISVPTLVGKVALCNKCSDPFELDRMALKKAAPVCKHCIKSPNQDKLDKAAKFFAKLEGEINNPLITFPTPDEVKE